jgi:hypothetical protein
MREPFPSITAPSACNAPEPIVVMTSIGDPS